MVNIRLIFNGAEENHKVDMSKNAFESTFENQCAGRGYAFFEDTDGLYVYVSPLQVPVIEIREL